jgi:hypothetical protein
MRNVETTSSSLDGVRLLLDIRPVHAYQVRAHMLLVQKKKKHKKTYLAQQKCIHVCCHSQPAGIKGLIQVLKGAHIHAFQLLCMPALTAGLIKKPEL